MCATWHGHPSWLQGSPPKAQRSSLSPGVLVKKILCHAGILGSHLVQAGYVIAQFFDRFHPLIQCSYMNDLAIFVNGRFVQVLLVTDSHFAPNVTSAPLYPACSPRYHSLLSCYPEGKLGHHVGPTAPSVSQHGPSPRELDEENQWQHSSKPVHRGQNRKMWTGRCRRHRVPSGSSG